MFWLNLIIDPILRWVFHASKESATSVRKDVIGGVKFLLSKSGGELKEFFSSAPMVFMFIRYLYKRRKKLKTEEDMLVLSGGVALGSILTIATVSILISAPIQLAIGLVHPIVGASLAFASGSVVSTVVVFLVWTLFYTLNKALSESSNYIAMREDFRGGDLNSAAEKFKNALSNKEASIDLDHVSEELRKALGKRVPKGSVRRLEKKVDNRLKHRIVFKSTDFPRIDAELDDLLEAKHKPRRLTVEEMKKKRWRPK